MDFSEALRVVQVTEDEVGEHMDVRLAIPTEVVTALAVLKARMAEGSTLDDEEAAAMYGLVVKMREDCERYERDLIRHLKHEQGRTWAEVAEVLQGQIGSRQAAQKKWARLTAPTRRVATGDYRRGAADPIARQAAVNDTMPSK